MPAPGQSTFDGNPNANPPTTVGYRPGLSDFNGAALTDDPVNPPDPATMPTSAQQNTLGAMEVSFGKICPAGWFGITAGVSPVMSFFGTAANNTVGNPYTIARVGAGNYQITWAANTFPLVAGPKAYLNFLGGANTYSIEAVYIVNGVQITTQQGGVLTDLNFWCELI